MLQKRGFKPWRKLNVYSATKRAHTLLLKRRAINAENARGAISSIFLIGLHWKRLRNSIIEIGQIDQRMQASQVFLAGDFMRDIISEL
jgi:hypothetical protein